MRKVLKYLTITGLILSIYTSCIKDDVIIDTEELTKIDRPLNFEGSLLKAKFKATDLFERMGDSISNFIQVEEDGMICIKYKDSMNAMWNEVVEFEDVSLNRNYPIGAVLKSTTEVPNFEERIKFNSDAAQRFDSMIIEEATMTLNLDFPENYSGPVSVKFPELTKDGQVLTFDYDASDANPSESEDLKGYKLIFSNGIDSSYITMMISADVNLTGTPPTSPSIRVILSLNELVPEVLFGYFGQTTILDREQTMNFGFFEDFKVIDLVEFNDIQMKVEFDNYFGIPYDGTLADAKVIRNLTGENLELIFGDDNTTYVEPALYNNPVEPTFNNFIFTKENSNIGDAVNMFPDKVEYRLQVNINPNGETGQNFITQDNRIAGNFYLIIPMWLKTASYQRLDTLHNFNLIENMSVEQIDLLESAGLDFVFNNWFPFELDVQVYFADENYTIVDSLFTEAQRFLETGILDADDIVTEASESKVPIVLLREDLKGYKEKNVNRIIIKSHTITAHEGTQFVKLFDYYGLDFNLSVKLVSKQQ